MGGGEGVIREGDIVQEDSAIGGSWAGDGAEHQEGALRL